jgi:hypothetical protein
LITRQNIPKAFFSQSPGSFSTRGGEWKESHLKGFQLINYITEIPQFLALSLSPISPPLRAQKPFKFSSFL